MGRRNNLYFGSSISSTIDLQRIMNDFTATKIRLNEQKCKRISIFFCFLECEYLRDKVSRIHKFPEYSKFTAIKKLQRHQLATLLPIGAFDSSDSPNATRMSSSEDLHHSTPLPCLASSSCMYSNEAILAFVSSRVSCFVLSLLSSSSTLRLLSPSVKYLS